MVELIKISYYSREQQTYLTIAEDDFFGITEDMENVGAFIDDGTVPHWSSISNSMDAVGMTWNELGEHALYCEYERNRKKEESIIESRVDEILASIITRDDFAPSEVGGSKLAVMAQMMNALLGRFESRLSAGWEKPEQVQLAVQKLREALEKGQLVVDGTETIREVQ